MTARYGVVSERSKAVDAQTAATVITFVCLAATCLVRWSETNSSHGSDPRLRTNGLGLASCCVIAAAAVVIQLCTPPDRPPALHLPVLMIATVTLILSGVYRYGRVVHSSNYLGLGGTALIGMLAVVGVGAIPPNVKSHKMTAIGLGGVCAFLAYSLQQTWYDRQWFWVNVNGIICVNGTPNCGELILTRNNVLGFGAISAAIALVGLVAGSQSRRKALFGTIIVIASGAFTIWQVRQVMPYVTWRTGIYFEL